MSREGFGIHVADLAEAVAFWTTLGADLVVEEPCDGQGPYAWGGLGRWLLSIHETGDPSKWTRGLEICLERCVISTMAAMEAHGYLTVLTVGGTLSTASPCGGIKVIVVDPRRAQPERRDWQPGWGESGGGA
jgi:hypothetical protein